MVINSISPFEGALVWIGQPSSGTSQSTGLPWKVVDFVIKYIDRNMQEQNMLLTASGVERVDKLLAIPLGTILRVNFQISARKSEYNGQEKWWGSLNVMSITPVINQQPAQQQQQTAPTAQPAQQQPSYQAPTRPAAVPPVPPVPPAPGSAAEEDLPF